jgi:hypothetical protein
MKVLTNNIEEKLSQKFCQRFRNAQNRKKITGIVFSFLIPENNVYDLCIPIDG